MLKVVHIAAGPADALHSGTFSDFLSQYLSKAKKKYFHKHWQLTTRQGKKALGALATLDMSKNELQCGRSKMLFFGAVGCLLVEWCAVCQTIMEARPWRAFTLADRVALLMPYSYGGMLTVHTVRFHKFIGIVIGYSYHNKTNSLLQLS